MERPLVIPLASLVAGLAAADSLASCPPHWTVAALLLICLAACFVPNKLPFLLGLSALFFVLGGLSLRPYLPPASAPAGPFPDQPVRVQGVVDGRPEGTARGGSRMLVRVERVGRDGRESGTGGEQPPSTLAAARAGRLLVHVEKGRLPFATGDRVLFSSRLREPRRYGLPGEPDYPRHLAYQGVYATAFVEEGDDVILVATGEGWRHRVDRIAAKLGGFVDRHAPAGEAGVLKALLLGDRSDVPAELDDAYCRSGVNHILSISGFHVGIVFLATFQLLFLLARHSEELATRVNLRKTLLFAAIPVVVFYLFLSGAAAATQRSVFMLAALVFALQSKREVDPVHALALAASAILFLAPETLFDVSFQLSFLAIWGLVVLAPALCPQRSGKTGEAGWGRGVARWFLLLLAASAAAILATLVPVAYHFQRVSLIGLLANLVVVPVLGYGAVVTGFLALPAIFVAPPAAGWLLKAAAFLVRLSDWAIVKLARAPILEGYAPDRVDILLACLVLCALTFVRPGRLRLCCSWALAALILFRAVPPATAGDGLLHLLFLSVGQGDATLVTLPDGKRMLIDGGGRAGDTGSAVGERLLLPALRRLGVRRIDYLVLTHEHPDHLQGVLFLAARFEVGEFWESGVPAASDDYRRLKWVLAARGIPVRTVNASTRAAAAGGATVAALWPPAGHAAFPDANDGSLVLSLRHGRNTVLLMGDLGGEAERELLARGGEPACTLLKVAHHGSRYSSTDPFLAAASPEAAVISAGYRNPFHLPAASTVQRLERHGIRVYRTDLEGSVEAVCRPDGGLSLTTPWGAF